MRKTFKKSIAVLLAVLMVTLSVPFTALATPGEYKPNITIRFGTVSNVASAGAFVGDGVYGVMKTTTDGGTYLGSVEHSGLYGAPIDYDAKAGTLTLKAENTKELIDFYNDPDDWDLGMDYMDEDYEFTEGDFFIATIMIENIPWFNTLALENLAYSDNIEPAGIYGYNNAAKRNYVAQTADEVGNSTAVLIEAGQPVATQNACDFGTAGIGYTMPNYTDDKGKPLGNINNLVADPSYVDSESRLIKTKQSAVVDQDVSVTVSDDGMPFVGPNGEIGYAYENTFIAESFMFKITGDGPIKFWIADTTTTSDAAMLCKVSDGISADKRYTYAINTYDSPDGSENPGSAKVYLFGENIKGESLYGEEKCEHNGTTHNELTKTDPATCTDPGTKYFDVICDLCEKVIDTTTEPIPVEDHTMTRVVTEAKDATCTADGNKVQMGCANCDYVAELETIGAYGHHDYTATSNDDKKTHKMTCAENDYSQDALCDFGEWVVTDPAGYQHEGTRAKECTVCSQVVTEPIPATDCEHKGTTHNVLVRTDPATCTEDGKEYYNVVCDICDEAFDTRTVTLTAPGHTPVLDETTAVDSTCKEPGKAADTICDVCKVTLETGVDLPLAPHTEVLDETTAVSSTCTKPGKAADTICDVCGETLATGAALELAAHTPVLDETTAVSSTCTKPGKEADTICDVCGETLVTGAALELAAHTPVLDKTTAVDSTCTKPGKEADTICDVCGETLVTGATLELAAHTPGTPVTTTVDATFDAPGSITTVTNCTACGTELAKDVKPISQLVGYTVTVDATGLGYVTLAGNDVSDGGSAKFEKGTKVVLTATPVTGAKFVGWTANGKTLVSTSETFTTTVLANVTYTPEFELETADTFTVQFVDAFGNVVKIYTDVTADTVANLEVPAVPGRPGYTATGWSVTDMATIESSAVITPVYEKAEATLYTVNVPEGAVVTVNGAVVEAPYAFPFDTKVTVTLADAEAWTVDGNAVAYGDSFSFFVTADVTLETAAGIAKTPSVAWVNADSNGEVESTVVSGKTKAVFKATRTMTDDCTFIDAGFVYGASALTAADLTLDNVNNSTIRASYVKTASEQFSLTVGIGTQQGTISAVAFVAYVDAAGATQVAYTPVATYTYR